MSAKLIVFSRRVGNSIARRNALAEQHRYLVDPIARHIGKRLPACFDLNDLISAGIKGLMRAAELYDPRAHNDTPFTAYARMRIRGEIIESVRRRHWVEHVHPNLEEAPDRGAMPDWDEAIEHGQRMSHVREAMAGLPEEHRRILELLYVEGRSVRETAGATGNSQTRTARIRDEALRGLRERVAWRGLKVAA